jgi:hypothetical protein
MMLGCMFILMQQLRRREIAHTKPGKMLAALVHKKDSSVAFIVDNGAFKTQVPESMQHKLRDVTKIKLSLLRPPEMYTVN